MLITRVQLENWKNFKAADFVLQKRTFFIGPNASGKSNLLDVFRFLRDVAVDGLESAVDEKRGGVSSIRSLFARRSPAIRVSLELCSWDREPLWEYSLTFNQDSQKTPRVVSELVRRPSGEALLERPNSDDRADDLLLTQTHLEQISANKDFREVADFLKSVRYQHLIPQAVRDPRGFSGRPVANDPYGRDLLNQIATEHQRSRDARLRRIAKVLKRAVPHLEDFEFEMDRSGSPHLVARYENWRPHAARQFESQLSDGTLRFFGLLWSLFEEGGPLLLEEPELSLHPEVVRRLPSLMNAALREVRDMRRKPEAGRRQLLISTHSSEMLQDQSIGPDEVVMLLPADEGTRVDTPDEADRVKLSHGLRASDVLIPKTAPKQLRLEF